MSSMRFDRLSWDENQFEESGMTLVDFTQRFLNNNRHRMKPPTRQEVNWHWEEQIMICYPDSDNETRIFLLEQESCPAIQQFWEQHNDEQSWKEKQKRYEQISVFHQSQQGLSKTERKVNRWAIIMTSAVKKNIIVPDISTFPLHRISYDKIARKVLAANPGKKLQKHEMEDLWDGIMNTIYDFEGTVWERKRNELLSLEDYRKVQEEAKVSRKRTRGEISDESDRSDVEVRPAMTKVKTGTRAVEVTKPSQATNVPAFTSPATPAIQLTTTSHARSSMQQAPDAVSTTRRTAVDRALLQVDDEPLMARSGAGMGVATPNTVPQRSALPANIVPARAPVSTSNQTTRNSAVHGNQVPARGRGIRRRPGNGPRQSAVGRRTQVDSEATLIPRPTRQPTAMTPTSGLSSAPTSSRRQFQPPPAPQVSDAYQLDRAEADMVRNGIAPWPYDPRTGAKTGNTSEYSYSTRDFRMLGNGIPPWPYDPKTGEKTKLSTGWKGYRVGSASKN